MKMRFLLSVILFFALTTCFCQSDIDSEIIEENGKCYQLSNISHYPEHAKYDSTETIIEVEEATTKWVKRKADRNCLSPNPDDCLVWCLINVDAIYDTVMIKEPIFDESIVEKNEVLCPEEVTEELVISIYSFLKENTDIKKLKKKHRKNFKIFEKRYLEFQADNQLPVGGFNLETMEHMGLY